MASAASATKKTTTACTTSPESPQIDFTPKKDAYSRSRGNPVMLCITCAKCDAYVMHYQKDGSGDLLRCYLDRIHSPEALKKRKYESFSKKNAPNLVCEKCQSLLGTFFIYKKENRQAYSLKGSSISIQKLY